MDREMKNAVAITKQGAPKAKPEKRKTICNGCKFAEWKKTKNGRLHPDEGGRCSWEKQVTLPSSAYGSSFGRAFSEGTLTLSGGYIWRHATGSALLACPLKEPADGEA